MSEHDSHSSSDEDDFPSSDKRSISDVLDDLFSSSDEDDSTSSDEDDSSSGFTHFPRSRAALDDLFSSLLADDSSSEDHALDKIGEELVDIVKELQKCHEEFIKELQKCHEESIATLESNQRELRKEFDEFKEMVANTFEKIGRIKPTWKIV